MKKIGLTFLIFALLILVLITYTENQKIVDNPKRITDYGAIGDGITDDSWAIQAAIDDAKPGDIIEFPENNYAYGKNIILRNKSNLTLRGASMNKTILKALDWTKTAMQIIDCSNIIIQDIQINSPRHNAKKRAADSNMVGFFAAGGYNICFYRVKVFNTADAGIVFCGVFSGGVWDSEIIETLSDGIHTTNGDSVGSSDIAIERNFAFYTGDDSFATVGYRGIVNKRIYIKNNISACSQASGVTVEGSQDVEVYKNDIYCSAVSAIRVGSSEYWQTSRSSNVYVGENTLKNARVNQNLNHPAIRIFAEYEDVRNIHFDSNTIIDPLASIAFQIHKGGAFLYEIRLTNNAVYDGFANIRECISIKGYIALTDLKLSNNMIFSETSGWRECNRRKKKEW